MRVALSWLAEWIDCQKTPEVLSEQLTMAGLEVDAIERTGPDWTGICVGHVVEHGPHPDADRLSVCQVELGPGDPVQIVCGAPNVAAGQTVAVALSGVTLPDGTRLKKAKIRGQVSNGMICSERELGLGEEHAGILVLDSDAAPGTPLSEVLQAGETVLDVAIMANRGDCASILGIAREVRAYYGGEITWPPCAPSEADPAASDSVSVAIEDTAGCHRYVARVVRGLRVGSSPEWLTRKLESAGLRPINNVVDVANLVMLEFGQPLHAFDLAKLGGDRVCVRSARAGESLRTLDGEERQLEAPDLVIADASRPIALAGVMGGAESEVDDATTSILIESAHFEPSRVRLCARRHGLSSDASYRFERGVDGEGVRRGADRAARLIAELTGGEVASGAVEAVGSPPSHTDEVRLELARLNGLLGLELSLAEVRALLERLGIESVESQSGTLACRIPSHRNDLSIREDLIEEVARIHGYDKIPTTTLVGSLEDGHRPPSWDLGVLCRQSLEAEGLIEVMSFPFLDPSDLDRMQLAQDDPRRRMVAVKNPLVESEGKLRGTLVPALLHLARENLNRQLDQVGVFELSHVFERGDEGELPTETLWLSWLMTQAPEAGLWRGEAPPLLFVAKGMAERLLARTGREPCFRSSDPQPYHHPGASSELMIENHCVGFLGELHPRSAREFEIDVPSVLVELNLSALLARPARPASYREVSPYPSVRRDLAVLLDRSQSAGEVLEAIRKKAGAQCIRAEVFDRYEGAGVPAGKVSLAFRLVFQRSDRTLTDAEVSKASDRVVQMLARRFGGELR